MLESIFGGWFGDVASKHFPNDGHRMYSQLSTFVGVPLSAKLLLGLPERVSFAWAYGLIFFFIGFLMSWNYLPTNWPICVEIVPTELQRAVLAVDQAIEKLLTLTCAVLVGLLAQIFFDYKMGKGTFKADLHSAKALAKGLFVLIACPFTMCFLVITPLYYTYPKDRPGERGKFVCKIKMELPIDLGLQLVLSLSESPRLKCLPKSCKYSMRVMM